MKGMLQAFKWVDVVAEPESLSSPSACLEVCSFGGANPNFMESQAMEPWWLEPLLADPYGAFSVPHRENAKCLFLLCLPVTATAWVIGIMKTIRSPSNCFNKVARICHDKHIYGLLINCVQGQVLLLNCIFFSMNYYIIPSPNIKISFLSIIKITCF